MKKIIRKLSFILLFVSALGSSGCFSQKGLNITTVYSFEGRYKSGEVSIREQKAIVKEKDSVWVLSNVTLYNLLTSVSETPGKVTFRSAAGLTEKLDCIDLVKKDAFDDEEFIWESWVVPTNGVR